MESTMNRRYAEVRAKREKSVRVVLCLHPSQVGVVDDWAINAGMTNRTAALRVLLERGLQSSREDQQAA